MRSWNSKKSVPELAWEAFLLVLVGVLVSYTWMFADISVPNERSRVYLASALVEHQTVVIDTQVARWGKIYDLAKRDGSYYSDKAPGSSILGAVVYQIALLFSAPEEWTIVELINLFRTWLMIPLTLLGFLFLRRILEYLGLDPPAVDVASLAWVLGTAAFHYGAAYFGHQIVAVALILAVYLILRAEDAALRRDVKKTPLWLFGAGAAAGIAGLTEYQAAIPCVALAFYVLASPETDRTKGFVPFIAGAAPFALMLLWYNDAAFGGPFELSYHYLADEKLREIHGQGIAGVTMPTWEYFSGSMFSLHRGLFTTSPLFLAALPGLWFMKEEGFERFAAVVGVTFLYFVAFVSSSNMWFAGWGFGPRLLVPMMGLLSIPVGFAVQRALVHPIPEGFLKGLAVVGIVYQQTMTAFFPEPPDSSKNPLLDVAALMWEERITSPNLGQKVLGLDVETSLYALAAVVAIAIAIVVTTGFRTIGWRGRGIVIAAVFAVMLGAATVVEVSEPSWDERQSSKWLRLLDQWRAREPRDTPLE